MIPEADVQLILFLFNLAKDTAAQIQSIRADRPEAYEEASKRHAAALMDAEAALRE
jgi:hypothetical protein